MDVGKGLLAGFIATLALSALLLVKQAVGLMPSFDLIRLLTVIFGGGAAVGWLAHFMIGTMLWGLLFPLVEDAFGPMRFWVKGMWFGVAAWLLMMVIILPLAGAGFFGARYGIGAPVLTLLLHLAYGWVLGFAYGRLATADSALISRRGPAVPPGRGTAF